MNRIKTSISGSFKFKKEIDELHDEFADYGVDVLEPSRGWLYLPNSLLAVSYRPLPSERHMPGIKEIEERFLAAVKRSNFLYLYNQEQYIGESAALEIGFAIGNDIPIFAKEPISLANAEYDLELWELLKNTITIASPKEATQAIENSLNIP